MYLRIRRLTAAAVALLMITSVAALPVAADTENNDTQSTAELLPRDTAVSGQVSTGDVDVYRFDVDAGEVIEVEGSTGGSETLRLELYAGGISIQQRVDSAFVAPFTGGVGLVGDAASADRTYYLRVVVNDGTGSGSYSLTLRTVPNADPEFNDDAASAIAVVTGGTRDGTVSTGDVDVYRIDRRIGETVRFEVATPGSETLAVGLYVDGLAIQQRVDSAFAATFTDGRGVVGDVAGRNATYYLVVSVNDGEGRGNYTLAVDAPPNDDFEPNEDRFDALDLFENPFEPDAVTLTEGDVDWFGFDASAGDVIEATVSSDGGLLGATLADGSNPLTSRSVIDGSQQTLTATAGTGGSYYLQLASVTIAGDGIDAEFVLTVDGVRLGLPNDRFERESENAPAGNADRANATPLSPGTYEDLAVVDDDEDWFAFDADQGDRIVATIRFAHADDDLTLELRDPAGTVVATGDSATDDETVDFVATGSGIHTLRVTGGAGERAGYSLQLALVGGVNLAVGPGSATLAPGDSATYDVVLSGVQAGVGPFEVTVESSDISVVTITGATVTQVSGSVTVASDGSSATVSTAADQSRNGNVVVARVSVAAAVGADGTATLDFSGTPTFATTLGSGVEYPLSATQGTDVTVSTGPSAIGSRYGTPNDVDGDGLYEDVNGDGSFNVIDVAVLLREFDRSGVQDQAAFFDFTADGTVNILDVADLLGRT